MDDEERFISFFDANYLLFKDRLIVIHGTVSQRIEEYLQNKSLKYAINLALPNSRAKQIVDSEISSRAILEEERQKLDQERQLLMQEQLKTLSDRLQNNLTVIDDIVRSGKELNIEGDLLLLNRVNSGATLNIKGNLIITQVVEGDIRCHGNFMMLYNSPKANIIFHDVQVDNDLLENKLNRIEMIDDEIVITPVFKKEINWVS